MPGTQRTDYVPVIYSITTHDGSSQHGPCPLVRQTIDITIDLSTLVVQDGTLYHRKRRYYCDIVTRVCWIARQTHHGCGSGPPDAPHTVGNGPLQVSRTNSGIRSLLFLVSAVSLVPSRSKIPIGHCNTRGTVPVHRAPSPGRLVHMHLVFKSATNAIHRIV
jgi:hypothetical protein